MKFPTKLRLTGFIATVLLGAPLIEWTERYAWRQADQLQTRFEAMQHSGYHLADYLEATILRLNTALLPFLRIQTIPQFRRSRALGTQ